MALANYDVAVARHEDTIKSNIHSMQSNKKSVQLMAMTDRGARHVLDHHNTGHHILNSLPLAQEHFSAQTFVTLNDMLQYS